MRTLGLLQRNHWEHAAQVIDLYANNLFGPEVEHKVDRLVLDNANVLLPKVDLTAAGQAVIARIPQRAAE